jgi:hypothetical protein
LRSRYPPKVDVNLDAMADMVSAVADGGIILSKTLAQPKHLPEQIMLYRALWPGFLGALNQTDQSRQSGAAPLFTTVAGFSLRCRRQPAAPVSKRDSSRPDISVCRHTPPPGILEPVESYDVPN